MCPKTLDIQSDFFPDQEVRRQLLLAHRIRDAFPKTFRTVEDVLKYIKDFKDTQKAELFLEIGDFYNSAKFYKCPVCQPFPSEGKQACSECKKTLEMPAFIFLIMSISIMEKLAFVDSKFPEEWMDSENWIKQKTVKNEASTKLKDGTEFGELIDALFERYHKEYGGQKQLITFMWDNMTVEERIQLVKSIIYYTKAPYLPHLKFLEFQSKGPQIFEEHRKYVFETKKDIKEYVKKNEFKQYLERLPICFDKERFSDCYVTDCSGYAHGYCEHNPACPLMNEEERLKENFNKTVRTIYEWRSEFVHSGQLPPIKETPIYGSYPTIISKKMALVKLTTSDLKPIFERLVMSFFDKFKKA